MLARSRQVTLAEHQVETPLLVPSISSKAVGPIELGRPGRKPKLVPASYFHSETFVRGIREALLISAFDISHRFIASPASFRKGFNRSLYAGTNVLFIDSGWYEKSVGPASGQWYHEVGEPLKFDEEDYVKIVDSLDPQLRAVLVSWDSPGTYSEQIAAAQDFFGTRSRFTSDILLKPQRTRLYHDFKELDSATAARLRAFNVVGVTEKDLGDSLLRRLTTLARLRLALDQAEVAAPIHIFGGLDPLTTPLYFAAGGEIFDGVAWLRYAFRDGMSIYREAIAILDRTYEKRFSVTVADVQLKNLDALSELGGELKVFFHYKCDWGKLRHGKLLKPAFERMESALRERHGR